MMIKVWNKFKKRFELRAISSPFEVSTYVVVFCGEKEVYLIHPDDDIRQCVDLVQKLVKG